MDVHCLVLNIDKWKGFEWRTSELDPPLLTEETHLRRYRKELGMILTRHLSFPSKKPPRSLKKFDEGQPSLIAQIGVLLWNTYKPSLIQTFGRVSMTVKMYSYCPFLACYFRSKHLQGFFFIYGNLFARLAHEETLLSDESICWVKATDKRKWCWRKSARSVLWLSFSTMGYWKT